MTRVQNDQPRPLRSARRAASALALLAASAWFGAGCADRRIDLRNLEAAMSDRYGRDARVPIASVTCPEWVRTREGDTFECQIRFEGGTEWTIEVTQVKHGSTRWTPKGEAVYTADLEPWLRSTLAEHGQSSTRVHCPDDVSIIRAGEPIACQVEAEDGETSPIRVTVDAESGLRLLEEP